MEEDIVRRTQRVGVLGGDGLWSVAEVLRAAGVAVVDLEPGPKTMVEAVARRWHYGRASVRAGLLGAPEALRRLMQQVDHGLPPDWARIEGGLAHDPFRETDPEGLPPDLATPYRLAHLAAVGRLPGAVDRLILPLCSLSGDIKAMRDDLQAACDALHRRNPGLILQVTLQPALTAAPAPVEALAQVADLPGLVWDPVFDALLSEGRKGRGLGLLAQLATGGDLGPAPPAPPVVEDRKARREKRRKSKGLEAKVVCEDELLEAFSK